MLDRDLLERVSKLCAELHTLREQLEQQQAATEAARQTADAYSAAAQTLHEMHQASEMRVQALTAALCAVRQIAAQRDIDRVLTYLSNHI